MSNQHPGRPRVMRQMLVLAALFGLLAVGSWVLRPRHDPRGGSAIVRSGTVHVGERVPESYRISYRIETTSGGDTTESRRDVTVRRPFDARSGDSAETFARHAERQTAFWIPPAPASDDRRPDALLRDAIADGYAAKRELREVAGRRCRVYRFGASSASPSLPRVADVQTPTDVCLDAAGLVLEEVTYDASGDVARRSVATSVSEHPDVGAGTFRVPKPQGDARQIGSVLELEPDSRLPGGTFWELDDAPKGFRSIGRYSVVPAGQPGFTDPLARNTVITFVSQVWVNGPDVLMVEQGAAQSSAPFGKDPNAKRVKVGELGRGELRYSMTASEVRVATGGTRFVSVRGTLAPSKLLEIARNLRGVPEGPLRIKDR